MNIYILYIFNFLLFLQCFTLLSFWLLLYIQIFMCINASINANIVMAWRQAISHIFMLAI